ETRPSRWGEGLTAEGMKKCVWLRPALVAQIEFLEWTESDHLRHSKFVGLRDDKNPRSVVKEHAGEAEFMNIRLWYRTVWPFRVAVLWLHSIVKPACPGSTEFDDVG